MAFGCARAEWFASDLPYRDYLSEPVTSVVAAGPSDVWAVTTYGYYYQDPQHVRWNSNAYHSKNDGLLWDLPFDAPSSQTDPTPNKYQFQDVQLYAAAFADQDNGWLFGWKKPTFGKADPPGDYVFYRTADRGRTWFVSTLPNTEGATPDEPDFSIDAQDAAHCYAVQGHHVFVTTDGYNWTERAGLYPRLFSVQAAGLISPRAAGTDATNGVSGVLSIFAFFQDVSAPGAFRATRFADADHGWVAGGDTVNATILGTSNGGGSWRAQLASPGKTLRGIAAPSQNEAWAVGQTTGTVPSGVILHTTNAGTNWTFDAAVPGRLFSVAFRDAQHGWAAGDGGVWRYVPSVAAVAGDVDRNGETDVQDIVAMLRRIAGVEAASPTDAAAFPMTIAAAVAARRAQTARSSDTHAISPSSVVVVYNTVSPDTDGDGVGDSLQVAQHYAAVRGIPIANLIPITWHDSEAFQDHGTADGGGRANWTDAFNAVVQPVRDKVNALGRGSVSTILFCTGTPFRVNVAAPDGTWESIPLDTSINDLFRTDALNWSSATPYFAPVAGTVERFGRAGFGGGARPMGQPVVDLSGATVRDPYYLVSRIDGPSLDSCLAMIDNARFAEQYRWPGGYDGTAYIDNRAVYYAGAPYTLADLRGFTPSFYAYADVDKSIARTILTFADRGISWKDEVTYATIGSPPDATGPRWRDGTAASSAPRAMFYAGWYNYGMYNDVWDWLPGSVGIDYDSASAYNFRGSTYFAGGALSRGLTALVGVLGEPYNYHPKPDALMEYLARGFTFAEAAMLSTETPRTARALFLGDPLYRPVQPLPPASSVPAALTVVTPVRTSTGWTLKVSTNIPVKVTLRFTTDGSDPALGGAVAPSQPTFYALNHRFAVPASGSARYSLTATDPLGRVSAATGTLQ